MIKKILVPMGGVSERSRHLDTALNLAVRFSAHVEAVHAALDPRDSVAYLGDGMTGTMIAQVMAAAEKESEERAAKARQVFVDTCTDIGVSVADSPTPSGAGTSATARFSSVAGHQDVLVAHHGRLSDLIVGGRSVTDATSALPVALEAAIMETGRPVLVTPPMEVDWNCGSPIGKNIALAWSGSPEAARAVAFAMPFLQDAERVNIIYYGEEHGEATGAEELQDYLAWHGIQTTVGKGSGGISEKMTTGENLLAQAGILGADLLVMGAFTHSRLRQIIFGGTTRHVMEKSKTAVLLAH
ncbi:MAG: universal stress protein [Rhodospirillales bacterium]|nr:universal stress protein [Rhodospirillales bacterium]